MLAPQASLGKTARIGKLGCWGPPGLPRKDSKDRKTRMLAPQASLGKTGRIGKLGCWGPPRPPSERQQG